MNGLLKAFVDVDFPLHGGRDYPGHPALPGVTLQYGDCAGLESLIGGAVDFTSRWIVHGPKTIFILGELGDWITLPSGDRVENPFSHPSRPHMTIGWRHPWAAVDAKAEAEQFLGLIAQSRSAVEDAGFFAQEYDKIHYTLKIEFKPFGETPPASTVFVIVSDVKWSRTDDAGDLEGPDTLIDQHCYFRSQAAANLECAKMNAALEECPYHVIGLQPGGDL